MNEVDLPRFTASRVSFVETAVISSAALAALAWVGPSPYLALAPLLAGVRYGVLHGLTSGLLLVLVWAYSSGTLADRPDTEAAIAALSWLIAGSIPGAFRDAWIRRTRGVTVTAHLLRTRVEELGRAYHVLHESHERLQRLVPGQPSSLREALERLRADLADTPDEARDAFAHRTLDFLRDHVGVRAATWHPVAKGRRPDPAIATLSTARNAEVDPLIRLAARLGEVVSTRELSSIERGSTLVAVPLMDIEGTVHAIVAIRELPFVALHEDSLSLLAVLGGHIGDLLLLRSGISAESAAQPQKEFCIAVSRSIADASSHAVPSSLVMVRFRPQGPLNLEAREALWRVARRIDTARSALDLSESLRDGCGLPRVFLLMRLPDEIGLARRRADVEKLARAETEAMGAHCAVEIVVWRLGIHHVPASPRELRRFLLALLDDGSDCAPRLARETGNVVQEIRRDQIA